MTGRLVIDTSVPDLLHIDSSNNTETFIKVFRNGTQKAAFGYYDGRGSFMYNWVGGYYFELTDGGGLQLHKGGTLFGNIWHSGNDGSGSGLDADLLDGYQGSNYLRSFWTTSPGYDASQYVNDSFSTFTYANNAPYTGPLFHLGARDYGVYFNTAYSYDSRLAYRRHGNNGDGGMGEWQYLARTSDLIWSNISGKPSSFTPSYHTHGWSDITGKPSSYTPSSHTHGWSSITSKPIVISTDYGSNNNSITTSQFLDLLEAKGLFGWGISRGSWYYAGNQAITDTGIGNIHLSGAAIQVIGYRGSCTIIVITPTTDSGNVVGETKRMFIYVDNGSSYSPGWFKLARTDELTWGNISGKPSSFTPSSHNHSASNITSGTLGIARGGTGASSASAARTALGITPANIGAAATSHSHTISDITNIHVVDALPSSPISGHLYFVY